MSESGYAETEETTVFFQKMNIRDIYSTASCGNGLHITIPAKLCRAFDIQSGDELVIKIERVQYNNLRDIKEMIDVSKPRKKPKAAAE